MKRILSILSVIILFIFASFSTKSFAAILEVCPNGGGCTYEYTTGGAVNAIQTAINLAGDGDTVYIHNGTYASPEIDMTSAHTGITIEGESTAYVILTESYFRIGSAINGFSTNITVENLTIRDSYDVNHGIEIVNSTGVTLQNLLITGSGGEGIKITGNATVDIYNCTISTSGATGVRLNGSGVQVDVYNSHIYSSTFQGVLVEDISVLNLINNRIRSNGTVGVQINQGTTANLRNNNVYSNVTYGFNVSSVTSLTNDYNNVYDNTSGGYTGTMVAGAHSLAVDPDVGVGGVLNCTSELINAGDPTITDVDGSVSDIGMYGGPGSSFDGIDYLCTGEFFCNITEIEHVCIECLLDADCTGDATCDLDTNSCEVLGVDDPPVDDPVDDPPVDDPADDTDLPSTSMYSEDPIFYTILSVFLIIVGYLLYAQKRYGKKPLSD